VFSCSPLDIKQWAWCMLFGVGSLVWQQVCLKMFISSFNSDQLFRFLYLFQSNHLVFVFQLYIVFVVHVFIKNRRKKMRKKKEVMKIKNLMRKEKRNDHRKRKMMKRLMILSMMRYSIDILPLFN
jgi:hypothetical protein